MLTWKTRVRTDAESRGDECEEGSGTPGLYRHGAPGVVGRNGTPARRVAGNAVGGGAGRRTMAAQVGLVPSGATFPQPHHRLKQLRLEFGGAICRKWWVALPTSQRWRTRSVGNGL